MSGGSRLAGLALVSLLLKIGIIYGTTGQRCTGYASEDLAYRKIQKIS